LIILLTGGVSLRYVSGFETVSVDVREVIVAGWWRGWELYSELGSFGSTVTREPFICHKIRLFSLNNSIVPFMILTILLHTFLLIL
jgi:hypothetical protein